jgi:DNA-binding MarR family transcriptional regulator
MTTELHDYGPLLIASRLRKLSEAFYAGADEIYRANGVELPARCFPILFLLRDRGRLGISEIAISLGQTHPAVSQMSRKLMAHEVIQEWDDPLDERRRLLGLSRRGVQLMKRLVPIWSAIAAAAQEIDAAHPILASLTSIDQALAGTDFATRIRFHLTND